MTPRLARTGAARAGVARATLPYFSERLIRPLEEQTFLIKNIHTKFSRDLQMVEDAVSHIEHRLTETESQIADLKRAPNDDGKRSDDMCGCCAVASLRPTNESPRVEQSSDNDRTHLTSSPHLRDQALTKLEALGKNVTYEPLLEALEARYEDVHIDHMFRSKLKDPVQGSVEDL
ncbi:hypothetical protein KGM_205171 [Danaus plexippus plexippus]|uniref:Uncharacterized protein n=1 Tax=Danaus plexippus plexippus TaxID=278856 RepID=A0A212EZC3_DANPL|nr:hypothetical protein KGM_205171 [Danaus plexippus plexippus]